jgi:hypothetical protein
VLEKALAWKQFPFFIRSKEVASERDYMQMNSTFKFGSCFNNNKIYSAAVNYLEKGTNFILRKYY